MSTFTKGNVYTQLTAGLNNIVETHKVSKQVVELLYKLVDDVCKPKATSNEERIKEVNGTLYYKCRFTTKWYTLENCVFSNGKYKGYSKVGYKAWLKIYNDIKKIKSEISDLAIQGGQEELIKEKAEILASLELSLNNSETYKDIEGDELD